MNKMLLIQNGHLMDPVTGMDEAGDILLMNGRIVQVGGHISKGNALEIIKREENLGTSGQGESLQMLDAAGRIVAPGLVDAHVHFRDPGFTYKEDILSGARAAARGGVTTAICMANTKPPVDCVDVLQDIQKRAEEAAVHVLQTATVTKGMAGKELVNMEELAEAGAAGFTDDGLPILDEAVLLAALEKARDLDLPVSLHEEDPLFVKGAGVNMGEVSRQLGYGGASHTAEDVMVARDCMLALHTGAPLCIQHISSRVSVELVRLAKKLGADIHAEATPHHFSLTEEAVLEYGTYARMNPPLRTEEDRQAILEGLTDGTIDIIVTDHAPHSKEEKARPMDKAPSGITGLETSLALGIRYLVEPGVLTLMQLLDKMSKAPAELYRMIPGSLQQDAPADLVIFGEKELWTVGNYASKAENSPFTGWELPGKVFATICRGGIVYHG